MATQLVGRESELAELVVAIVNGSGAALVGVTGVGKTALARAVAQRLDALGEPVEWLVATEASRLIPFGALAPLLPADLAPLDSTQALAGIIRRHGRRDGAEPTVLVVDDAHLLDDHSAAALLGLVASAGGRVLLTLRTGEVVPDAVRALWKDGLVTTVEVAPFDMATAHEFLVSILGDEVASGTAMLLWQHTRGNALFLAELARQARLEGQLIDHHGVWVWHGEPSRAPQLADLVDRRFDGLDLTSLDALGILVMAEPVTRSMLNDLVGLDGMAELETRRIVESSERGGVVAYRFAHPMLAAAAAPLISSVHRRRLADALIGSSPAEMDVVRRAMWHLEASVPPDVEVLITAARTVFLTQPGLARRLAERACACEPSSRAALLVADACAELGQLDAAREAQALAATCARTDADRLAVRLNQVSLTAFSERRPDVALEMLAAARAAPRPGDQPDLDAMTAQVLVFSSRPAEALPIAESVLAAHPSRSIRIHASNVRVMALALVDRPTEALDAAKELIADLAAGPTTPYARGIAHIADLLVRFLYWVDQTPSATTPSGRWPLPPPAEEPTPTGGSAYPLFEGAWRLLEGHADLAVVPLREALAQQLAGEGLLRSEAVALLVIALASAGEVAEAQRILRESPPDRVALLAGLRPWAESAVAAATGGPDAVPLALAAYQDALAAGCPVSAVAYLDAAAHYGAAIAAADLLDTWGYRFDGPMSAARASSVRALARGDGHDLLDTAERHAALGLLDDARRLAELAAAALGRDRTGHLAQAKALAAEMRRRLDRRQTARPSGPGEPTPLSRRELEVARLAAKGLTDRQISDVLVLSVRTVESHLAATYRKLDITSRRDLRDLA